MLPLRTTSGDHRRSEVGTTQGEELLRGEARRPLRAFAQVKGRRPASPPLGPVILRTSTCLPPPEPLPQPSLTLLAAGERPQHTQQCQPPAQEPHGAERQRGPPPRPKGNLHSDARRAPRGREAGQDSRVRGPATPSWNLAAASDAILMSGRRLLACGLRDGLRAL